MYIAINKNDKHVKLRVGGKDYWLPASEAVLVPDELYLFATTQPPFNVALSQGLTVEEVKNIEFKPQTPQDKSIPHATNEPPVKKIK